MIVEWHISPSLSVRLSFKVTFYILLEEKWNSRIDFTWFVMSQTSEWLAWVAASCLCRCEVKWHIDMQGEKKIPTKD